MSEINMNQEGPPRLIDLTREWIREDPTLSKHFYFISFVEGVYIETYCNHSMEQKIAGYGIARLPVENAEDNRVVVCYHGYQPGRYKPAKVRGYLRPEDPQFFQKLREYLIKGHDMLWDITNCRIKWKYGDLLPEAEEYARQTWWEGRDNL